MSSRFWNFISNLLPGETARASEVNAQFAAIDAALLAVANELNRCVRFTGDSPAPAESYMQVANTPAQRVLKVLGFDGAGRPTIASALWAYRGPWVTLTAYGINDVVLRPADGLYVCAAAHTSSALFSTDIALSRWVKVIDLVEVSRAVRQFIIIGAGNSPYNATPGDDLMVDVSAGPVSINLPASPVTADQPISIVHIDGPIATNQIRVVRNGNRIMGLTEDMFVSDPNAALELAYSDALRGWRLVRGT